VLRDRFQIDFFAPHQSLPELPSVEAQQQSVFHRRSLDQRGNPRRQSPRSWIDGLANLQLVYLGSRTGVPIPVGMTNPVLARQSGTADYVDGKTRQSYQREALVGPTEYLSRKFLKREEENSQKI